MKPRYKETTLDSFYGNFLYERKVPQDHFLKKLNEVIDWSRFTKKLLKYYKGKGEIGQAPYNPCHYLKDASPFLTCIASRRGRLWCWLTTVSQ